MPRHDDDSIGEMWRAYREDQRARRAARLPGRQQELVELRADGYTVRQLTPYAFRVNDALDLYPTHRRYHALRDNRRGTYRSVRGIVRSVCGPAPGGSGQ